MGELYMRRTKIIATVGPATDTDQSLDALIAAGVDIFRLNFSHGTHESQTATYKRIRAAAARAKRDVAILQDLGGPKIRTGATRDGPSPSARLPFPVAGRGDSRCCPQMPPPACPPGTDLPQSLAGGRQRSPSVADRW